MRPTEPKAPSPDHGQPPDPAPLRAIAAFAVAALVTTPGVAQGQLRGVGELRDYVTGLNQTCPIPEGVAVDERSGTVFASSLGALTLLPEGGFTQPSGAGSVCVVGRDGKRVRRIAVAPGASGKVALFGMDYVRGHRAESPAAAGPWVALRRERPGGRPDGPDPVRPKPRDRTHPRRTPR